MEKLNTIQTKENLNHVFRDGEPGPGGAHHDYCIAAAPGEILLTVQFQKGPRNDPDARHGVLDCDLLEIVRDRMKAFVAGPMTSWETEMALSHVEAALHCMNKRVEDRIERNVLGTMEK